MALADYYDRAAVAASQVIAGFDATLFRRALEQASVGIALDARAAVSQEGKVLAELSVRLLARLYPRLELRVDDSAEGERLQNLALKINPHIEIGPSSRVGIAIGADASRFDTTCFAGSDGWDALLSNDRPLTAGTSPNPLGAGAAACLAAASVFNHVLVKGVSNQRLISHSTTTPSGDVRFSTFSREKDRTPDTIPSRDWRLGEEAVLVGVGAIGNASAWALARSPLQGTLHIVDPEVVELSNLQRYVLAERTDDEKTKVDVVGELFHGQLSCVRHTASWAEFVRDNGYGWRQVIVALDSAADRRSVQAALPEWIANAWTQPGDLGVSVHDRFDGAGACLYCLYLSTQKAQNEDEVVAAALGIPQLSHDVRTLLHTGAKVARPLLEAVARGLERPLQDVLLYEGRTVRELYVQGICGGGLIPLGTIGLPRQEVHVPLAHQSALAGILLSATLVRRCVSVPAEGTSVSRIDITVPIREFITQPALKAGTGLCICEDEDYVRTYRLKFTESRRAQSSA
jgi:hypothetical protein